MIRVPLNGFLFGASSGVPAPSFGRDTDLLTVEAGASSGGRLTTVEDGVDTGPIEAVEGGVPVTP